MRRALTIEDTMLHQALLCRSISLEAFLINSRILAMIVRMHLNVTGRDVSLITFVLNAMVVRLFSIVLTVAKLNRAVV